MKHFTSLLAALVLVSVCATPMCQAQDQAPPGAANASTRPIAPLAARQTFEMMMDALKDDDYNAFISMGTPNFQQVISKTLFEEVAAQVGSRIKEGTQVTFLERLKKNTTTVYLWKIEFKSGDDMLAQMALANGKVAGFLLT